MLSQLVLTHVYVHKPNKLELFTQANKNSHLIHSILSIYMCIYIHTYVIPYIGNIWWRKILANHTGKSNWWGKIWQISYSQCICQIHFRCICDYILARKILANSLWFSNFPLPIYPVYSTPPQNIMHIHTSYMILSYNTFDTNHCGRCTGHQLGWLESDRYPARHLVWSCVTLPLWLDQLQTTDHSCGLKW